ncbi:MAG: undecaprenyl-phosphate glucose phosphotransferase [Dysgonomonas sp.]
MEIKKQNEGYGHLIKWLVKIGDILVVNLFFFALYIFLNEVLHKNIVMEKSEMGEFMLLVNLSYFVAISIIDVNVSMNILFFDKILQKSFSFVSLYMLVLITGVTLFNIIEVKWIYWLYIYLLLIFFYTTWHVIFRVILKAYRKRGHNYKRVIVVGGGLNGVNVYKELSSDVYGYRVLGYFDDNPYSNNILPNYLGNISKVEQFCIDNGIDEIYCTLPGNQESKILNLMNFSERNMIRFYLVPEFYKYIKRRLLLTSLQTIPVVAIREEPLQSLSNRIIKRSFDLIFSSVVLVTIFPVIYIIFGTLIKVTSPGPIFFRQQRTGLGGKTFDCYKFRSMRINREADVKATVKSDPRVTKVGQFMRKTSIDEIPQFINVFLGNMSVVGPRPHMIQQTQLYEGLIDKFMVRHLAKPGITGWAQVTGYRGETRTIDQMEGRFKRDVWYIENWSFFLDIKIIVVTILNLFRGEDNAY